MDNGFSAAERKLPRNPKREEEVCGSLAGQERDRAAPAERFAWIAIEALSRAGQGTEGEHPVKQQTLPDRRDLQSPAGGQNDKGGMIAI